MKSRGKGDLYHRYRPHRFDEIVGHTSTANSVKNAVAGTGQAFLLTGESGTGKTTTARIIALAANCSALENGEPCLKCSACKSILSGSSADIMELNAADARGIDAVRDIAATMGFAPMFLKKRIYIFDEAHQLTNDAQNTLLKYVEDVSPSAIIILCSTHPKKIIPTLRNRCQTFKFGSLKKKDLMSLLSKVAKEEGKEVPAGALEAAAEVAEGSPRKALVSLQQLLQLDDLTPESLNEVFEASSEEDPNAIKLAIALDSGKKWKDIVSIYEDSKSLGAPALGMVLAGFFRNKLLKTTSNFDKAKAYHDALTLYLRPFDTGKLGENQLVSALFCTYLLLNSKS